MYYPEYHDDYLTNAHKAYLLHGFLFYDLLPEGMELLSTPEEIAASMELGYDEMGWWAEKQDIKPFKFLKGSNVNEGAAATGGKEAGKADGPGDQ
mgnify:CR=1 FL=1